MNSPFKFLDAYNKEDAHIFFGRDLDINLIFEKIHREKLLLIYGASGTGKTSLIQCGLANQFEDTDWFPIIIRRNKHLLISFLDEINNKVLTPIQVSKHFNFDLFRDALESLYLDFYKPIFLIFDQLEELFISGNKDEIVLFFEILNKILESDLQIKIILIIREEYLAYLTNMEFIVPKLFENRHRVETMSPTNIKEVIYSSCNEFNIKLENEQIADLIYDKLSSNNNDVELTHLQVFLDRLYKSAALKSKDEIVFSPELIENIGFLEDVLGTFLSEQMGLLKNPNLGWEILKFFITNKGTKKSIDSDSLFNEFKKHEISFNQASIILDGLTSSRVLKLVDNNNYELSHDSLALKIYDRLSIKEKNLMQVKWFLEQEYINYESRNVLLNQQDLDYITPYLNELKLAKTHQTLIQESKKELNKKRNRLRWVSIIIIIALSTLSIFSLYQWHKADVAQEVAEYERRKAVNALKEKNEKEEERLKAEADKVIAEVNRIITNTRRITTKETVDSMRQRAINILKKHPDNPHIVEKLNELKNE